MITQIVTVALVGLLVGITTRYVIGLLLKSDRDQNVKKFEIKSPSGEIVKIELSGKITNNDMEYFFHEFQKQYELSEQGI